MALTTYTLTTASQNGASIAITEDFDVSVSGTFNGMITLQRSFDSGTTWRDVQSFVSETEGNVRASRSASYRFVTNALYTGSATIIAANNV